MSEEPADNPTLALPPDADLTTVFLEHAECGGAIDVVASEPGELAVRCSGCESTLTFALPGVAEAELALAATPPALDLPGSLPEEPPLLSAGLGDVVPVRVDRKPPRRPRSRLRLALPALLGVGVLLVAILVASSIGDSEPSAVDTVSATPEPAAGDSADASEQPADREGGARDGAGAGGRGERDPMPAKSKPHDQQPDAKPKGKDEGAGKAAGGGADAVELNFAVIRGDVRIGVPRDWAQRGTTANGAIQFAPSDNTVAVQIFYELDAQRTSEEFARRARRFIRERREGARPAPPEINGNEAWIRSPYGGGVELTRTVIDGNLHAMAIATIPDASPAPRGIEARALLEAISGP